MIPDVPAAVLASVRSTSDRPIPHPRQEPTMTAPHPSPAGLSPLLDQLDEARAKATAGPWAQHPADGEYVIGQVGDDDGELTYLDVTDTYGFRNERGSADAACIVAEHNAIPLLTAAIRAVAELADVMVALAVVAENQRPHATTERQQQYYRGEADAYFAAAERLTAALTAALTPGADTAGATA